jgi:hypothetical protein
MLTPFPGRTQILDLSTIQAQHKKSFTMTFQMLLRNTRHTVTFQMLLCGECYEHICLKVCKLSIVQDVERWIVYTSINVNVFITLATQYHLECHCKALSETAYITSGSHIEP